MGSLFLTNVSQDVTNGRAASYWVLAVQNFKNMRGAMSVLNIWDMLLVLEV